MLSPANALELTSAVRTAAAGGQRIRMTGSGHSHSDVAVGGDHLLLPQRLNRMMGLDRGELSPAAAADPHLVRVQSGITLRELNRELARRKLALENLGDHDAQTIAGAMMTATHGSGLAFGPIVSQVVSIQIVADGAELLQIEPTHGITVAARFKGRLAENEAPSLPVRLIQDDDVFRAVSVSMGCMGIVYAVVLRTVDAFWLREQRSLVTWEELAQRGGFLENYLAHPRDPAFADHVEIAINPYPMQPEGATHAGLLTQRWRSASPPPSTAENQKRGQLGNGHPFAEPLVRNWTEADLLDRLDPRNPGALSQSLRGFLLVLEDAEYVAPSYDVFNLGDVNRFRVVGIEMAVELSQTRDAVQLVLELAERELAAGRHHALPVRLRFAKAAEAFLAMQQGRDTMLIEVGTLAAAQGAEELLETCERTLIEQLRARPHWGLDLSILKNAEDVARLYPRWDKWHRVYTTLNASGTFNGALTDRLGISLEPH